MIEQLTLDGLGIPLELAQRVRKGNPLIPIYGPGPVDARCGDCTHLYRVEGIAASSIFKCELRRNTSGAGTDHRARWPACARYEAEQ